MQWDNKCLNVWLGAKTVNNNLYNCRVTDTGDGVVLVIQRDGDMIVRETYHSSVDEVKTLAESFITKLNNNRGA
jgi:hypothetical protein